ncbi:MAG: hypothetical protein U0936_28330 [Planctomycetaceae bacterium]
MNHQILILSLAANLFLFSHFAWAFQAPGETPNPRLQVALAPDYSPRGGYLGTLSLPPIVRYPELPLRMHLDVPVARVVTINKLDPRLVPLWDRMLREGTDPELVEVAALSLATVAEQGLSGIEVAEKSLQALATNSKNPRIQNAAAFALAAGNIQSSASILIRLAEAGDDDLRLRIEPPLIRWKTAAAIDLWTARLHEPLTTNASFRLASEGLASLNDQKSLELLLGIAADPAISFAKRIASARASAILSVDRAYSAGEILSKGNVQDRLLALALWDTEKPEAKFKSAALCEDSSDAVASVAWQQVFRRNSELLQGHLPTGRKHRDAQVRLTAARTMRLWPDPERALWLQELLSDIHIEVRNVARNMLVLVSTEHPEFKEQIVSQAAMLLKPESNDWQGLEQSLLLLAQLQATQFSHAAFALLGHAKDEVVITAAWLIQLFPDEAIYDLVRTDIEQCEAKLSQPEFATRNIALRETMLLQYAGLVRMKELQTLMDSQFSKSAAGTPEKRGSALWALAVIREKTPDEELTKKYEERILDRSTLPPESLPVRYASVMALGLLRSAKSVAVVRESYDIDPRDSGIPDAARWTLSLLGEPMPPELVPYASGIGGWRITPIDRPKQN